MSVPGEIFTLRSGGTIARVATVGAELKGLSVDGTETIWQGDERFWDRSGPTLFPICGGLKNDRFEHKGQSYFCPKHGFARNRRFLLESAAPDRVTLLLCADDEIRRQYPFEFELRVRYTLSDRRLSVDYTVWNCSDEPMYFSIGAHEGYACPEGIAACELLLPEPESLLVRRLERNLLSEQWAILADRASVLPLRDEFFAEDALIFDRLRARRVTLRNRVSGRAIELTFDGFDSLLVWSKPGAPFVCLEPWCGITDPTDTTGRLCEKLGIHALPPGEVFARTHTIRVL